MKFTLTTQKLIMSLFIVACMILGLGLESSSALTLLPSFNIVHGNGNPTTSDGTTRPTFSVFGTANGVDLDSLAPGQSVVFGTKIKVNQSAADWGAGGNLITVGFARNNGNFSVFDTSHETDPLLYFQNNTTGGTGVFWNNKFFSGGTGGTFVFGNGGLGGYPNDNLGQTAPEGGSFANYTAKLNWDGSYELNVQYLDPLGNPLTNLGSIGSNPQTLFGTVGNPNDEFIPVIRLRPGFDSLADWSFTSSDSFIDVVPEPSRAILALFGLGAMTLSRRRQSAIA